MLCIINVLSLMIFILFTGCNSENSKELSITEYNLKDEKVPHEKIPDKLREISGLAMNDEGRIFAVCDEKAVVYELDEKSGEIKKFFYIGKRWAIEDDFEGIECVGKYFYLVTSRGVLYKFEESKNGQNSPYDSYKTGLSSSSNVEGLAFDKKTNSLLIACKEYPGKKYKGNKAVYSFSLNKNELDETPRFLIDLKDLNKNFGVKEFYPSGIAVHPVSGKIYIISARNGARILTLDEKGEINGYEKLNAKFHRQPEGICFLKNNTMVIADEGSGKSPTLTRYEFLSEKI